LRKQSTWSEQPFDLFHFRQRSGTPARTPCSSAQRCGPCPSPHSGNDPLSRSGPSRWPRPLSAECAHLIDSSTLWYPVLACSWAS
jgi:hypothetical protein